MGPQSVGHWLAHSAALSIARIASRIAGGRVSQTSITWTSSGSIRAFSRSTAPDFAPPVLETCTRLGESSDCSSPCGGTPVTGTTSHSAAAPGREEPQRGFSAKPSVRPPSGGRHAGLAGCTRCAKPHRDFTHREARMWNPAGVRREGVAYPTQCSPPGGGLHWALGWNRFAVDREGVLRGPFRGSASTTGL